MNEQAYPYRVEDSELVYRFESHSASRIVNKVVLITQIRQSETFNLALLDELETGELSDTVVSDNDDMPVILATVFRIVADFLHQFPMRTLFFQGSDDRRNRLYRIVLSRELEKLEQHYDVYGFNATQFVLFEKNTLCHAFLIRKQL